MANRSPGQKKLRTPEDRAENLRKIQKRARKGYRIDTTKRRKMTDAEIEVLTDSIVCLKVVAYSNQQIAMITGISKGQVASILDDKKVQNRISFLKEKMPEAAVTLGRAYLVEAVQAVVHVMRQTDKEEIILRAAAELFDRFGVPKISRTESKVEAPDSHPLDDGDLMDKLRSASPEIQQKVADMHEMFLQGVATMMERGE